MYRALFVVLLSIFLVACAPTPKRAHPDRPLGAAGAQPDQSGAYPVPPGALPGRYSAAKVSGDYAGYPAVDAFVQKMASKHGFPREYLQGVLSQAKRKQWTINYMNAQSAPSGTQPKPGAWSRYRAKFLTEQHIAGGAAFWRGHSAALQQAASAYGVPPEYIVAIIGVETQYGRNVGNHRILDALTTLAFDYPRRADYFAEELENFLLMSRDERIDPAQPVGSFAGAMGLGQFMPGSFLQWAVDFDGDGRRNLWDPEDAIGCVAHYFAEHGWRRGEAVVAKTQARPAGQLETGFDAQYSADQLASYGIRPSEPTVPGEPLRLLLLRADGGDEYWLGQQNFYVITRYNHSTHYAMAVHHLAQAVKQRYQGTLAAR
ncbi:lytic murein transglycosylase B [Methylococcus sp. EFPC2]|uniref:lytic murein transglycosylase B n=1 Tax=Methylococcus sp. EFPC2 TaxID=2812648 RepID=UPI001967FBCE|nr:lytic murein transglycosylase B [Methylococcus sp. EFPC2]QSA98354.1 lytic murein transglycosylase B [Methylococcus sp. EFPC2]